MADAPLLILGGTTLAGDLARQAAATGQRVIYSLAGRTKAKAIPDVSNRTGGFGGAQLLAKYLHDNDVAAVIDATHAYAAQISSNAEFACRAAGKPLLRLEAPPWEPDHGDHWIPVDDIPAARDSAINIAKRIFVTTGRQDMAPFATDTRCWWLARVIAPGDDLPSLANGQYVYARGPFEAEDEVALMREHGIGAVISKNAGGAATYAKIAAARELSLPVIMVSRPPPGNAPTVATIEDALAWLALTFAA